VNTSAKNKPTRISSANTTSYNNRNLISQGRIRRMKKRDKSDLNITSNSLNSCTFGNYMNAELNEKYTTERNVTTNPIACRDEQA